MLDQFFIAVVIATFMWGTQKVGDGAAYVARTAKHAAVAVYKKATSPFRKAHQ